MNKLLLLVASASIVLTTGCQSTAEEESKVAANDSQKIIKRCVKETKTGSRVPKRVCRTGTRERLDILEAEENVRQAQIEMDRARNAISAQGASSAGN